MNKSFDNICDYFFIQFQWFPLQSIVIFLWLASDEAGSGGGGFQGITVDGKW